MTQGTRLGPKFILQPQGRGKGKTPALTTCRGPSTTQFPVRPLTPSLTRSLWALRSSCRNSRRAPRTDSGSRSGDAGEVAGPGDGGSDPGLRSKGPGLGLLSPSPLPRGGNVLRDAGATGLSCQDGVCKLLMHFPHPYCVRMSFPQHTLGLLTLLPHPAPTPTALRAKPNLEATLHTLASASHPLQASHSTSPSAPMF